MKTTEMEILNKIVGGIAVKDMTAITFYSWMARMINGIELKNNTAGQLVSLVASPPMTRTISDDEKIRLYRMMEEAGINPN